MKDKINALFKFLREVRQELKKVTWPSRKELIQSTQVVFVTIVLISLIVWLVDLIVTYIINLLI